LLRELLGEARALGASSRWWHPRKSRPALALCASPIRALIWLLLGGALACSAGDDPAEPRLRRLANRLATEVVRDAQTGLSWTPRDSGRELSWREAEEYCRAFGTRPGDGEWRLPSIEELAALYDPSKEEPCDSAESTVCRIDPAIDLSSPYQWSASGPQPERRAYYDFSLGSQLTPLIRPTLTRRALCTQRTAEGGA
jgi:hypothetical protein